jgi:hypothetical protein
MRKRAGDERVHEKVSNILALSLSIADNIIINLSF